MAEILPINTDILKWARESMGLSIEDVAQKMNKKTYIIESWEKGEKSPTYPQLEKLAYSILKRPVALFFFPDIPDEDNPRTELRTLPDIIIDTLPPEIISLYRKAKVFQLNLEDLYDGNKPLEKNLLDNFSLDRNTDIEIFAGDLREYLKVPIEEQFSWNSFDIASKKWRNALENTGIFIFKDAFRNDDYSGFCVNDDKYPLIYVNNSMPTTRQIFTIFHELGHLLMNSGGIDFRNPDIPDSFKNIYSEYETLCNKFTNNFLVPSKYFESEKLIKSEKFWEDLSEKYCVSREVILRNYLDRGLVTENEYDKYTNKWIEEAKGRKERGSGGNYYYNQMTYLGEKYINLAFSKFYQEKITIENLSEILNIKVKNIPNLEHYALS
ncbi:MAG: ImmA/IrrE family metallo-endopeptidase [Promethearchaeota archaeon]